MGFALLIPDISVMGRELIAGLVFIAFGLILLRVDFKNSVYVAALLWLLHGLYDSGHHLLFENPGVWSWYPTFCCVFDITMAAYLLYRASAMVEGKLPELDLNGAG